MVHAKNYETLSTLVKVMQKKPWPLFSWTRCIIKIYGLFRTFIGRNVLSVMLL